MNAVIALCSFCEQHGPSVMFCTQAFHPEEMEQAQDLNVGSEVRTLLRESDDPVLAPFPRTLEEDASSPPPTPTSPAPARTEKCDQCRSIPSGHTGFISKDKEANVSYVSSQYPPHPQVYSMVRQACIRSLSCEVCPGREGPIFFGDAHNGHVLSYPFQVRDAQGRAFERQYSLLVMMMDKTFLLNSWSFLVQQLARIVGRLQENADKVFESERSRCPQRAGRLGTRPARSLSELTNQPDVFRNLHQTFTWILKVGGSRLTEQLFEGPPTEDSIIDMEKQEETEEGFVKLFCKKVVLDEEEMVEGDAEDSSDEEQGVGITPPPPTFVNLRHLLRVLGYQRFHELAYHVIIGNQVIVRGPRLMVRSALNCLKMLLPNGCCRAIYYSSKYEDSWRCNFLGIKPDVQVPGHVKLCVILEMARREAAAQPGRASGADVDYTLPPPTGAHSEFHPYTFKIKTMLSMPEKEPVVLRRMEFALMNEELADSVVEQSLLCLKEEWMNKVKVLFKFTKAGGNRSDEDTRKLMQVVGAQEEDQVLLKFWMTGLSVQYRNHTLSSAIQSVPT